MSYKITIKGEAKTSCPYLEELDGIDCQDCFSEYFDGDESFAEDVSGGYMHFKYEDDKLMTYTVYTSTRELTKKEEQQLIDYTQGQWSDGIGEGFEQESCHTASKPFQQYTEEELADIASGKYDDDPSPTTEVIISPWYGGQVAVCIQEQIKEAV